MKRANKLLFVLLVVLISLINMPLQGFLLGNQYDFNWFANADDVVKISDINFMTIKDVLKVC